MPNAARSQRKTMVDGPRYSEDRIRVNRVSRRTSAEDTGTGITMSEAHVNQKSTPNSRREMMKKKRKSKANSRHDKSKANSRQEKNK